MPGIIQALSGAPGAATTAGGYYQNALGQLVNATGSPAAQQFAGLQNAALQPQFANQDAALQSSLAASGITDSGAASKQLQDLVSNQSSTLAGADAPLYSQALGQYGNILGQEPGAQTNAYQQAINNFYQGVSGLGNLAGSAFGLPGAGSALVPGGSSSPEDASPGMNDQGQYLADPSSALDNPIPVNQGNPYVTTGT